MAGRAAAAGSARRHPRGVPEVTTSRRAIERRAGLGYTTGMQRSDEFLGGPAIAAYVTWLAVALGAWPAAASWPALGGLPARGWAVALMLAFLTAFVAGLARPHGARRRLDLPLVGMSATALALLWLGPGGTTPVLLIIVAGTATVSLAPRAAGWWLAIVNAAFLALLVFRWRLADALMVFLIYGGFQAQKAAAGANAVAQYHGTLVPPFCTVLVRGLFQQVLAAGI